MRTHDPSPAPLPARHHHRPGNALDAAGRRIAAGLHARVVTSRGDVGQGTVEYVALILLVGAILSAVVASGAGKDFNIADTIGNKLGDMIKSVGK